VSLNGTTVKLTQETRYPWDGDVKIRVEPAKAATFDVYLRIPGWCSGARFSVNGQFVNSFEMNKGYARVHREWKPGDVIELELPMPIERVESHPLVKANVGRVALQRGPIVYCLEGVDNGGRVLHLALPRDADVVAEHRPDLLGGVTVINGTALAPSEKEWDAKLYRTTGQSNTVKFTAVPYYSWDHRDPGEMVVWLPEDSALAEISPGS
jgi:DUF1680 family protein